MLKTLVAGLLVAGLFVAAPADAKPSDRIANAVCSDLYANPFPVEVDFLMRVLLGAGYTVEQAAQMIVFAVTEYCPDNWYVLESYASGNRNRVA